MSKTFEINVQLTIPSLRVIKQVMTSLSIWGMGLAALVIGCYCFFTISLYQCKLMFWYVLARIFIKLGHPFHQINIEDGYGEKFLFTAFDFATSDAARITKRYLIDTLLESIILAGVFLGVILIVIVFFFFWNRRQLKAHEKLKENKLVMANVPAQRKANCECFKHPPKEIKIRPKVKAFG